MNILLCSVGRRGELIKYFHKSLGRDSKIIATDNSITAPALYLADKQYIVPKVTEDKYIYVLLDICIKENVKAITTLIDPEIEILSKSRNLFEEIGIEVLTPYLDTAKLCFDKYRMYEYLIEKKIKTITSYKNLKDFIIEYQQKKCVFPVFVKSRTGSGSKGARKVYNYEELKFICSKEDNLIIQEFMDGSDLDVDVYIDTISHRPVSIFMKEKLETRIGGASKTISFKDERLYKIIEDIVSEFNFNGPIDMDFFYKDGEYYLSEINPRFGGGYLHAYGCGVDFIKLINNNLKGIENKKDFGNYDCDVVMMMYDSVVIAKKEELVKKCTSIDSIKIPCFMINEKL